MTVTAADVCAWARVPTPDPESTDVDLLARVLAAVTERARTYFGFDPDPAEWTADQDQAVIEVAAEQWVGGRNTSFGVAEFDGSVPVRANSIDFGLKRRLPAVVGFA